MKYNKQRNKHYEDLRLSDVKGNKTFWKTNKPLFGNKSSAKVKWHLLKVTILSQTARHYTS